MRFLAYFQVVKGDNLQCMDKCFEDSCLNSVPHSRQIILFFSIDRFGSVTCLSSVSPRIPPPVLFPSVSATLSWFRVLNICLRVSVISSVFITLFCIWLLTISEANSVSTSFNTSLVQSVIQPQSIHYKLDKAFLLDCDGF